MSLLESVWVIVKGNIGLLLGSFSAFMSVLLGGGTAVLNFLLNTVTRVTRLNGVTFILISSDNIPHHVVLLVGIEWSLVQTGADLIQFLVEHA